MTTCLVLVVAVIAGVAWSRSPNILSKEFQLPIQPGWGYYGRQILMAWIDDDHLLFDSAGESRCELHLYNRRTKKEEPWNKLHGLVDNSANGIEFSPDGAWLLLEQERNYYPTLYSATASGEFRQLVQNFRFGPLPAGWLSDNRHFIDIDYRRVSLCDVRVPSLTTTVKGIELEPDWSASEVRRDNSLALFYPQNPVVREYRLLPRINVTGRIELREFLMKGEKVLRGSLAANSRSIALLTTQLTDLSIFDKVLSRFGRQAKPQRLYRLLVVSIDKKQAHEVGRAYSPEEIQDHDLRWLPKEYDLHLVMDQKHYIVPISRGVLANLKRIPRATL